MSVTSDSAQQDCSANLWCTNKNKGSAVLVSTTATTADVARQAFGLGPLACEPIGLGLVDPNFLCWK